MFWKGGVLAAVITINGKGKRNACVISGTHGNELTSIAAVHQFSKYRLENLPYKKITIIPVLNASGFTRSTREFMIDLNRDPVHRHIFEFMDNVIKENDVIIDVHSSPNCDILSLIDKTKYTTDLVKWAQKAGINYCIRKGVSGTIKQRATHKGKIALTLECSGMLTVNQDHAKRTARAIYKLLDLAPESISAGVGKFKPAKQIHAKAYGMFLPTVKLGEKVKKGQIIGHIYRHDGKLLKTVKTSVTGSLIVLPEMTIVHKGEDVAWVQPTA